MKKIIIVLLSFMTLPAFAEVNYISGFYVGGAATTTSGDYDGSGVELMAGYKYNSFVGAEVRLGTMENDINYVSTLYRVESANATAKTYLIGGYTYGDVSGGQSLTGVTFGAGVGFVIFDALNLNLEYRGFRDNNPTFEARTFSVGVDYRF